MNIPIEVSARHVHLTEDQIISLFGEGYSLSELRKISQPGQFATEETVSVIGPKFTFDKVRIVGPARSAGQVEISITDARKLGIDPVIRVSGDHSATPGIKITGPVGEVVLESGVLIAQRHIHASPSEAIEIGVKDGDIVSVKVESHRSMTFHDVAVRVRDDFSLAFHLDTDEWNAAGIKDGDKAEIV